MLRKISLLILICICLVGCGETATLLDFLPPERSSVLDLGQRVVTIGTEEYAEEEGVLPTIFEHKQDTAMYDAILDRIAMLEDKYNCKIEFLYCGYGNKMIENMMPLAYTGDPEIDIIFGQNSNMMGHFAFGGLLYPLTELKEYLDYENSEKFGSAGLLEAAMINGIPYAVQPVQWAGFTNSFAYYITWNRELFNEYAMPELHEYYENNTWTFETFENLFAMYEKVANEDIDFASIQRQFFTMSSMWANGVKFCANDGEGFYSDFTSDKSYKAIDWTLNLYNRYQNIMLFQDDAYEYEEFCAEKAMLMPVNTKTITQIVPYEADFEFGIMPFPCGPDGVYGEWSNFVESLRGFGISNFSDLPDAAAIIINDLAEPFEEIGSLNDYYREQVFFTDLDTDIFLEVGKNIRHLYSAQGTAIFDFMRKVNGATSVAQLIQAHEGAIEALVLEHIRPNYEKYIYEHLDS